MPTTLKEEAWQSGLVLSDGTAEWNENDWPPLMGGWRYRHATVVLDHPDTDGNGNNPKRQTVVVMGGRQQGQGYTKSVLVLNLAESNKQWREGPSMNKARYGHASVVCNGGVYVMGGYTGYSSLDCIEQINATDLLQLSSTSSSSKKSHWTTLTCRLSTRRSGCGAVAVHNRYIVGMGGYNGRFLSSVDIIDTRNHTVTPGPSMAVPRSFCASAVIGHRIFVVAGQNESGYLDSVEYLDFSRPCDHEQTKRGMATTSIPFFSTWITHSHLVLSYAPYSCTVVAVGSCLVVAGGYESSVEVLDTHHNRMWNLPGLQEERLGCSMVTVTNHVAVIGGWYNPTCATLPLMDKHTWCFRRLFEQQPNKWCLFREGRNIQHADISPFSTSASAHKRARPDTRRGDEDEDET